MEQVYPLADFGVSDRAASKVSNAATDWYTGQCPQTGQWHRLPRTPLAEQVARGLMAHLAAAPDTPCEGKMYGVLLVETATGAWGVLKAFSGLLQGQAVVEGWVPPIPGRAQVALAEARTLAQLAQIKQEILTLQALPERADYARLAAHYAAEWENLTAHHRDRKGDRAQQRQRLRQTLTGTALAEALARLERESQQEGIARRRLKQARNAALQPLQATLAAADDRLRTLKQTRKRLSQDLQAQMHAVYRVTNFAGASLALDRLVAGGLPTGTGDCAAPKLLHHAATHGLRPLALAEFWWGAPAPNGDKQPGEFYGACVERCQPIMGFLLAGLSSADGHIQATIGDLSLVYQDDWLIVVDKPAGLLSVPGRTQALQDSVLSRLRCQLADGATLRSVHRLDKDTSGLLAIARDAATQRALAQQFQTRQVAKTYEAILTGSDIPDRGLLDLPLSPNLKDRPKQGIDWHHGKPSQTQFRCLSRTEGHSRVEFVPLTGRTHQLRVHAADPQGLNAPILGDRLYSPLPVTTRLHLHAKHLSFSHPATQEPLEFTSPVPF